MAIRDETTMAPSVSFMSWIGALMDNWGMSWQYWIGLRGMLLLKGVRLIGEGLCL